jgi:hypothetical protein
MNARSLLTVLAIAIGCSCLVVAQEAVAKGGGSGGGSKGTRSSAGLKSTNGVHIKEGITTTRTGAGGNKAPTGTQPATTTTARTTAWGAFNAGVAAGRAKVSAEQAARNRELARSQGVLGPSSNFPR